MKYQQTDYKIASPATLHDLAVRVIKYATVYSARTVPRKRWKSRCMNSKQAATHLSYSKNIAGERIDILYEDPVTVELWLGILHDYNVTFMSTTVKGV